MSKQEEVLSAKPKSILDFDNITEMVELPSGGEYYDNPNLAKGGVEIYSMTARHEEMLSNSDLIKEGIIFDRLLEELLVSDVNHLEMYMADRNAVLVAARKTAFGPRYSSKITCLSCTKKFDDEIDLDNDLVLESFTKEGKYKERSFHINDAGRLIAELPNTGHEVEVQFLTGEDEQKLKDKALVAKKLGRKFNTDSPIEQLKLLVKRVAHETNPDVIEKFIEKMPAEDSKFIREVFAEAAPNVYIRKAVKCGKCGHEEVRDLAIDATFFWSK